MGALSSTIQQKIAFSMARGMQGDVGCEMLKKIGSVSNFFSMSEGELAHAAGRLFPIFTDAYRQNLLKQAEAEVKFIADSHTLPLFYGDPDFPERVRQCVDAPLLLYKLGACSLNPAHAVAIVGTRHCTHFGVDFTKRLVRELAQLMPGIVIVSGLAFGIDIAAHTAALECGLPTVAVLAHGLNTIYPAEHRDYAARIVKGNGALVTEYATGARIHRSNFLARNRIVAGLCDCTVVVESDIAGGSMSTARIALAYNRDVFAVPGRPSDQYSKGPNRLIANNTAFLLTSAKDIVDRMGWGSQASCADEPESKNGEKAIPAEFARIYEYVSSHPDDALSDIAVALGISIQDATNQLFQLEMDDLIIQIPGGRYAPAN